MFIGCGIYILSPCVNERRVSGTLVPDAGVAESGQGPFSLEKKNAREKETREGRPNAQGLGKKGASPPF